MSASASANYVPPNQHRHLRACMVCSIVQTYSRFVKEGCPNCDSFLHLQGSSEMVGDCTSQVFEGLITLAEPSKSWIARWQRIDKFVKGVYAVKVSGVLSEEVKDLVEGEGGIRYISRDGGDEDDV